MISVSPIFPRRVATTHFELTAAEERMFDGSYGRMRDIVIAPDGALLIVTDEDNGALLRVSRGPGGNG